MVYRSEFIATFGLGSVMAVASPAGAAIFTDDFQYADQAAFEAAYTLSGTDDGEAATLLEGTPANKRVRFNVLQAGDGNVKALRNAESYAFGVADPITISLDVISAGSFMDTAVGFQSVSDPDAGLTLLLKKITGANPETQVSVRNDVTGSIVFYADADSDAALTGNSVGANWQIAVDSAQVTVSRDGTAVTNDGGTTSSAHGLVPADYASGVDVFLGAENNIDRNNVLDSLQIEANLIPEPGSMALMATGGVLALARRRRGA